MVGGIKNLAVFQLLTKQHSAFVTLCQHFRLMTIQIDNFNLEIKLSQI
jgi:hypothetical protein